MKGIIPYVASMKNCLTPDKVFSLMCYLTKLRMYQYVCIRNPGYGDCGPPGDRAD